MSHFEGTVCHRETSDGTHRQRMAGPSIRLRETDPLLSRSRTRTVEKILSIPGIFAGCLPSVATDGSTVQRQ